jgi:ubiquinone/menaquinone biosynthesis C-methylase UbiE
MDKRERARQKTIAYHSRELRDLKARAITGAREALPEFRAGDRILDIGCGAGQTLLVAASACNSVGLDINMDALELGRSWKPEQKFVCARAEALPFAPGSFDLVMARVSLEYTNLPVALAEVARVLKPGGRFWTMLVSFGTLRRTYLYDLNWRRLGAFGLVSINGLVLHFLHRPLKLPASGFETFQTQSGFQYLLERAGFEKMSFEHEGTIIASANKPAAGREHPDRDVTAGTGGRVSRLLASK